jgi:hypothetical protein
MFNGTRILLIDMEIYLPTSRGLTRRGVKFGKAWSVRLLLVGNSADAASLADELKAADLTVERWPEGPSAGGGAEEVAAIARELRKFERALNQDGPDAVLLGSNSNAALAAVLVATKLGAPVVRVELAGTDPAGANADLIGHLADAALAPEPAAIVDWVRDTYTPRG